MLEEIAVSVLSHKWSNSSSQGIDATKEIRNKGYLEDDLPVVALTASIQSVDWAQCGMNDCIKKPVRIVDLKQCLAKNARKTPDGAHSPRSSISEFKEVKENGVVPRADCNMNRRNSLAVDIQ